MIWNLLFASWVVSISPAFDCPRSSVVHLSHLSCPSSQQTGTWDESLSPADTISICPSSAEPQGKLGPGASVQKFSQMKGAIGVSNLTSMQP